jgi:c(7)-type cytochrome triheme protein
LQKTLFFSMIPVLLITLVLSPGAQVGGGDRIMKTSFGDVAFSHDRHAAKGLSCRQCHPEPYVTGAQHKTVTMQEMEAGASCGLCHNGKPAFTVKGNCTTCHKK